MRGELGAIGAGGPTRTVAARAATCEELCAERPQRFQQLTATARKPWTALKSLKAILKDQNAHVERNHLSGEFTERLLEAWLEAFVVYAGEGGAQDRPRGLHRLRNIREHRRELGPGGIVVGHSNLLTLHGPLTRYVTGVLLASRRWLHRKAGIRQVFAPGRGLSDATPTGGGQ